MDKQFIDELVNMVFLSDAGITSTSKGQIENTIINELKALASIIYELNKVIYQSNVELILKSISSIDKYYCLIVEYSQEGTSNCGNIFSGYDILDNYQKLQNLCDKRTFGQYYTPKLIVKSILDSLEIDFKNLEKFKILDPTCGGGAFFLGILDECKQANVSKDKTIEIVNKSFYGCDLNPNAVFLTKLCIIIHLNYLYEDFSFSNDLRKLSFDDHFTQGRNAKYFVVKYSHWISNKDNKPTSSEHIKINHITGETYDDRPGSLSADGTKKYSLDTLEKVFAFALFGVLFAAEYNGNKDNPQIHLFDPRIDADYVTFSYWGNNLLHLTWDTDDDREEHLQLIGEFTSK